MLQLARHGTRPAARFTRSSFASRRAYTPKMGLLEELEERCLLGQVTKREKTLKALMKPQTIYTGIDPTAQSLHIGHLLPLICLLRFQLRGHTIIPLIGGATALIGDPTGRAQERKLMSPQAVAHNVSHLTTHIETFFRRATEYVRSRLPRLKKELTPPTVVNNLTWYQDMKLLDFLRVAGSSARITTMLARDSVQLRLNNQRGLSFTEFSYQLLQAYDFYHLFKTRKCTVQIGGADQWGNIVAGIDMINHHEAKAPQKPSKADVDKAHGLTTPLLVNSQGEKMGKTLGDAIWLDPEKTSPLDLFQFFLKTSDQDVGRYLKRFTFLSLDRIESEVQEHTLNPGRRRAQQLLAGELIDMIHGPKATEHARLATSFLHGCDYTKVMAEDVIDALRSDRRLIFRAEEDFIGKSLTKLVVESKIATSNGQARTLIKQGGLYLNNQRVESLTKQINREDLIDDRMAILRRGCDTIVVICLEEK